MASVMRNLSWLQCWLNKTVNRQPRKSLVKYTSVLSQLLGYVPRPDFQAIGQRQQRDKGVRSFSSWTQSMALFYGQLNGQHNLKDLETAINSSLHKLHDVGLRAVRCSTLADANSKRSHEILRELFFALYES